MHDLLTAFFLIVTYMGGYMVVAIITTLTTLSFVIHKHARLIKPFLVSILGTSLSVFIIKEVVARARPESAFYIENSHSFPSGHAAIAVALYGFLLTLIWKHEKHHLKNKFIIFLFALIALIGISRLYLEVHYISDVLAGYLLGIVWLSVGFAVSKSKI